MEEDNFNDEEYEECEEVEGPYYDEGIEEIAESDGVEEIESDEVEETEESEVEEDRTRYIAPPSPPPARTPKLNTSAPRSRPRTFYSVKSIPKFPVVVPKTPQSSKKRNFDLQIARELYDEYNKNVFGNRLPEDLPILWSVNMRTTAGHCKYKVQTLPLSSHIIFRVLGLNL